MRALRRLRFALVLSFAALAWAASASAATVRPMLSASPFTPLAGAGFTCFNGFPCYFPNEIRAAYDFPSGPGAPTGLGQTIVVVTSYGAPFLQADVNAFAAGNGYPFAPNVTVETQQAPVPGAHGSGATYTWQVETNLDVQWAYAMAPQAHIVVAVASSDDTADVAQVMREVLPKYPGAIVTQSFGIDETGPASDPGIVAALHPLYLDVLRGGGTVLASSGDLGASNGTELERAFGIPGVIPPGVVQPSAMAAYPASDPLVLAVGGTEGAPDLLSDAGGYGAEAAWNEVSPFGGAGAGGGAPSVVFDAPPWQRSLKTKARLEPDVSYNAAVSGGALVVLSCRQARDGTGQISFCNPAAPGLVSVGGTSAAAPQWAAIVALANELRARVVRPPLGLVSPLLYELARNPRTYAGDFHDVTAGDNGLDLRAFGAPAPSRFSFPAGPGYDLATGLGTPSVSSLLADLSQRGSGEIPGNVARLPQPDSNGHRHRFDPSR